MRPCSFKILMSFSLKERENLEEGSGTFSLLLGR